MGDEKVTRMVVISKDRPAQLDLFLRSLERVTGARKVIVLYAVSFDCARQGYDILKEVYPTVEWVQETHFPTDIRESVGEEPYFAFFVDDDIFYRPFKLSDAYAALDDPQVLTYSPRCGENVTYCYTIDRDEGRPRNATKWRWCEWPYTHGYPGSVDGHIYRTEDMKAMLGKIYFENIANFEGAFNVVAKSMNKPLMAGPEHSVLVNLVVNRVQNFWPNRCPHTQSAEELAGRWLAGQRIGMPDVGVPKACHMEWTYKFEQCLRS